MSDFGPRDLGELLGLIVHDLRNPAATLGANVSFLKEVSAEGGGETDEDLHEAIEDTEAALGDLRRGLDQLGWIGRWLAGHDPVQVSDGDVVTALEKGAAQVGDVSARVDADERPLRARGAGTLVRWVELALLNSRVHARGSEVVLSARREGDGVVVAVRDDGPALATELRSVAFTPGGQVHLKGRSDGRYGRVAALFAMRVLADAMGATMEVGPGGEQGWLRLRLHAL